MYSIVIQVSVVLGYLHNALFFIDSFAEPHMSTAERKIILSGSFNPLHEGHMKLLEVATRYNS